MLDSDNTILYIGKAKCLRNRLKHYTQAKPGRALDRTLEMIENTSKIQWLLCHSEKEALEKESALLHAIRPPFNIMGTEPNHYLFIGTRKSTQLGLIDFQLSSRKNISENNFRVYGCFKHRSKIKKGYTALLRLIYACTYRSTRFSYPARMTRTSPPWNYTIRFPLAWEKLLHDFLTGKNCALLHQFLTHLLESDSIPRFMYPSLQEDIEIVQEFFETGPKYTYELRQRNQLRSQVISHLSMDRLIAAEVKTLEPILSAT